MPFSRPTLAELNERIKADITTRMGSQASVLRRAWTTIYARALAGTAHLIYGFLDWCYRQFFATTAEREALLEKGKVYGLSLKVPEYANGFVRVTGSNLSAIPIGTIFKRADGFRYATDEAFALAGSFGDVHVKAELAGSAGNLGSGQPVSLESGVAGINDEAFVSAANPGPIENGFDEEDIEAFRKRYLLRTSNPPQGGAKADYELWASEVPGVGYVKVYTPKEIIGNDLHPITPGFSVTPPIGDVWVFIASTDPDNPTPSSAVTIAVQNKLDLLKSATANVQVFPIVPKYVSFNMNVGLVPGSFTEVNARDQITAELKDLFIREARPYTTIRLSQINEAISNSAAENFHELISPTTDVVLDYNEIAVVQTPITVTILPP